MKKLLMALAYHMAEGHRVAAAMVCAAVAAVVTQMLVPVSALAGSASAGHRIVAVASPSASAGTVTLSFVGAAAHRIISLAESNGSRFRDL